jgi:hypothetical protein
LIYFNQLAIAIVVLKHSRQRSTDENKVGNKVKFTYSFDKGGVSNKLGN